MSKLKIGADSRAKLEEKSPYFAVGIIRLQEGGFGVVRLKVSGMEILDREVLKKASTLAEALDEYKLESATYGLKMVKEEVK